MSNRIEADAPCSSTTLFSGKISHMEYGYNKSIHAPSVPVLNKVKNKKASKKSDKKRAGQMASPKGSVTSSTTQQAQNLSLPQHTRELSLSKIVSEFEAELNFGNESSIKRALDLFESVYCEETGPACLMMIASQLAQAFLNAPFSDNRLKWSSLCQFQDAMGLGSFLHSNFSEFCTHLKEFLDKYADDIEISDAPPIELVDLVISFLRTSCWMFDADHLAQLQLSVCRAAARPSMSGPPLGVLKLLNCLLENNHDLVPLPLQIAHSVFYQDFAQSRRDPAYRDEVMRGRSLCSLCSRPKFPAVWPMAQPQRLITSPSNDDDVILVESDQSLQVGDDKDERGLEMEIESRPKPAPIFGRQQTNNTSNFGRAKFKRPMKR